MPMIIVPLRLVLIWSTAAHQHLNFICFLFVFSLFFDRRSCGKRACECFNSIEAKWKFNLIENVSLVVFLHTLRVSFPLGGGSGLHLLSDHLITSPADAGYIWLWGSISGSHDLCLIGLDRFCLWTLIVEYVYSFRELLSGDGRRVTLTFNLIRPLSFISHKVCKQ